MFNYRMLAVLKREIRERLLSKSFILMTLLIPLLMFGIIGIQALVMANSGNEEVNLTIISDDDVLLSSLKQEFSGNFKSEGRYSFQFEKVNTNEVEGYVNTKNKDVFDEKITGIVFVPKTALQKKDVNYFSKNPKNYSLFREIKDNINNVLIQLYFKEKNLNESQIEYARSSVDINEKKMIKEGGTVEEGYGNLVISFLFSFLIYFSLIFIGSMMMRSVIEEKTNRIVEIILSSIQAKELLAGKILGTAITGFVQMAIWLSPVLVLMSTSIFALPAEFNFSLSYYQVGYFLLNFFIGMLTFLGLFAAAGSIFDNEQDSQQGMWPVMMLIMIPFFISMGMQSNPANTIATVASFVPYASIIVMPTRMTLLDIPSFEILISLLINLVTLVFTFLFAGKIYKIGIIMTGKKPKWSEVAKWIKA